MAGGKASAGLNLDSDGSGVTERLPGASKPPDKRAGDTSGRSRGRSRGVGDGGGGGISEVGKDRPGTWG